MWWQQQGKKENNCVLSSCKFVPKNNTSSKSLQMWRRYKYRTNDFSTYRNQNFVLITILDVLHYSVSLQRARVALLRLAVLMLCVHYCHRYLIDSHFSLELSFVIPEDEVVADANDLWLRRFSACLLLANPYKL